jgi:hypothetical protein
VWDTGSGQQVLNLNRHAAEVTAVGFSYDGRRLLTASSDQLACVWASINISPTIVLTGQPLTYDMPGQAASIDEHASLQDPDAPHFDGGQLTAQLAVAGGEPAPGEQIAIRSNDDGVDRIRVADGKVLFDFADGAGPIPFGVLGSDGQRPGTLTVTLNERATKEAVQSLLQHITYVSPDPLTLDRQIRLQLDDGQGGVSHPAEWIIRAPVKQE